VSTISYININLKAQRGCPTLKSLNKFLLTTRILCKQGCKTVDTNASFVRVCLVVTTFVFCNRVATGQSGRAPLIVVVTETFGRTVWNSNQSVTRHLPRTNQQKVDKHL